MALRSVDNAVIVVIGASGGLGSAVAAALESRGATVVRAGRREALMVDIRDSRAGATIVTEVNARYGRLDGVVNAAGIVAFGDLVDTDDVVIEELFLTNVIGPLWLMKSVATALGETKGFFVNISAVVAEGPLPGMAAYSASKAALSAAARAVRREWRRMGITLIDIRPPHTETGLADRPIAGQAPRLPVGLAPASVAERIVTAIENGDAELSAEQFTDDAVPPQGLEP